MASVPPLLAPKDRDSILELVVDRVLVAMERFQSGDLNPLVERVAAVTKPRLVGLASGPDLVQQPGPEVSVLVTGQIDHAGELLRPASALVDWPVRDVMPHMFVDAKTGDPDESALVRGVDLEDGPDRHPHRLPRAAELPRRALLHDDLAAFGNGDERRPDSWPWSSLSPGRED
jgi:hypothetical protein